jgi:hypothetical protein
MLCLPHKRPFAGRSQQRRALKFDRLVLAPGHLAQRDAVIAASGFEIRNPIAHPNHNRVKDVAEPPGWLAPAPIGELGEGRDRILHDEVIDQLGPCASVLQRASVLLHFYFAGPGFCYNRKCQPPESPVGLPS